MTISAKRATDQGESLRRIFGKTPIHDLGQGVRMMVALMTPEMWQVLLDTKNEGNRNIRKTKLDQYKQEMERKRWRVQNPCVITESGRLLDGQHRGHAVVETAIAQWFIFQVVPDSSATPVNLALDCGGPRDLADTLHNIGVKDRPKKVAGVLVHERNYRVLGSPVKTSGGNKVDYVKLYGEIKSVIGLALDIVPRGLSTVIGVKPSILDWFALHLNRIDHAMAEMFFELLKDDSQLKGTDAVKVLREELQRMDRLRKTKKIANITVETAFMFAKAWNLHYTDQSATPSAIKFRPRDEFPVLKGSEPGGE